MNQVGTFLQGTQQDYDSLESKDNDTFYRIIENGNNKDLYLGDLKLSGNKTQSNFKLGNGLKEELDENGNKIISVEVTSKIEANNNLPITSSAIFIEIGNIGALLETI